MSPRLDSWWSGSFSLPGREFHPLEAPGLAWRTKVPMGVIEAVNGNIKALLRRGRGYRDLNYLLLKAQRLAATKTEFLVLQKAA